MPGFTKKNMSSGIREPWGFEVKLVISARGPVPFPTGGACCFRWVPQLGTYRDGTAVGNVTNVVCRSNPCSQRYVSVP